MNSGSVASPKTTGISGTRKVRTTSGLKSMPKTSIPWRLRRRAIEGRRARCSAGPLQPAALRHAGGLVVWLQILARSVSRKHHRARSASGRQADPHGQGRALGRLRSCSCGSRLLDLFEACFGVCDPAGGERRVCAFTAGPVWRIPCCSAASPSACSADRDVTFWRYVLGDRRGRNPCSRGS